MSDTYVKGRWKEGETEILKRLIREQLGTDMNADIKELGKMVEREGITIPWSAISKRMGRVCEQIVLLRIAQKYSTHPNDSSSQKAESA